MSIVEATVIKESGDCKWPWEGGGIIVVRGGSGGDGAFGSGNVGGGKGGMASHVMVADHFLAANGGNGGTGIVIGLPPSVRNELGIDQGCLKGTPGQRRVFSVSLAKGTALQVHIGPGGEGGKAKNGGDGADGADGEVLLIPLNVE